MRKKITFLVMLVAFVLFGCSEPSNVMELKLDARSISMNEDCNNDDYSWIVSDLESYVDRLNASLTEDPTLGGSEIMNLINYSQKLSCLVSGFPKLPCFVSEDTNKHTGCNIFVSNMLRKDNVWTLELRDYVGRFEEYILSNPNILDTRYADGDLSKAVSNLSVEIGEILERWLIARSSK